MREALEGAGLFRYVSGDVVREVTLGDDLCVGDFRDQIVEKLSSRLPQTPEELFNSVRVESMRSSL